MEIESEFHPENKKERKENIMQLLFGTWNHIIPLTIVKNKTLKVGDIVNVRGQKYYINCQPKTISPSGKKIRFYYCVKTTSDAEVTNSVWQ